MRLRHKQPTVAERDPMQLAGDASWTVPLAVLRRLPDEELERRHDHLAASPGGTKTPADIDYYLNELARRRQDRQTRVIVRLTAVITVLTLINVIVAVALLAK